MTISSGAGFRPRHPPGHGAHQKELGVKTILGSATSPSACRREIVNSAFYLLALEHGLDAAIINPNAEAMMESYFAYRALAAKDPVRKLHRPVRRAGQRPKPRRRGGFTSRRHCPAAFVTTYEGAKRAGTGKRTPRRHHRGADPGSRRGGWEGFEKGTIFLPQLS